MKISAMQAAKAAEVQLENIRKNNLTLLDEEVKKLGITEVPESIHQLVSDVTKRLSVIRFASASDYPTQPVITAECDGIALSLGEPDHKTGFIPCFIFHDEFALRHKKFVNDAKRKSNLLRIKNFLEDSRRKLVCTESMEKFVLEQLPAQIPYVLAADGSDLRVRMLIQKPDAKLYASEETKKKLLVPDEEYVPGQLEENDIFAVEYTYKGSHMLTIYVRSHDFKREQAQRLEFKLKITDGLAQKICENLPHDMYYAIADLHTDFKDFVARMASLSYKRPGDTIHDYVSGEELDVVFWDEIQKNVIDADDEVPCAVLIGPSINVFVPNSEA